MLEWSTFFPVDIVLITLIMIENNKKIVLFRYNYDIVPECTLFFFFFFFKDYTML